MKKLEKEEITDVPIISKNNITVYESHSRDKCIRFGKGQSFCISQPGNTQWQSYRDINLPLFILYLIKIKMK
jgi:hypothetical protein